MHAEITWYPTPEDAERVSEMWYKLNTWGEAVGWRVVGFDTEGANTIRVDFVVRTHNGLQYVTNLIGG